MKIRWLLKAVNDLEDIHEYISLDDISAARRELEKIIEAISLLIENPEIGRKGRVDNTRELVVTNSPYIIAYRLKEGFVEILRILHGSLKWPEAF